VKQHMKVQKLSLFACLLCMCRTDDIWAMFYRLIWEHKTLSKYSASKLNWKYIVAWVYMARILMPVGPFLHWPVKLYLKSRISYSIHISWDYIILQHSTLICGIIWAPHCPLKHKIGDFSTKLVSGQICMPILHMQWFFSGAFIMLSTLGIWKALIPVYKT
jgi:hypothetical protein